MKKIFAIAAVAAAIVPAQLTAKPVNAADVRTSKADGSYECRIIDATGTYSIGPCRATRVRKTDKDGNLMFYFYQDSARLLPGQVAPDRAMTFPVDDGVCVGQEVVTPSGQYSSRLRCTF